MTTAGSAAVVIGILGPLEIRTNGELVGAPGGREGQVLAWLAAEYGSTVSIDLLTEGLWRRDPPQKPAGNIQAYVSRLRKRIGTSTIRSIATGYALDTDISATDAASFEELAGMAHAAVRSAQQAYGAELAAEALDLWRGDALEDFRYEDWAQPTTRRLDELRLSVLEDRIEADLDVGGHGHLIADLQNLVDAHPTRERFRWLLMLAFYRSDRQAEALAAYRDAKQYLGDELGLDPSPELQDLEEKILLQDSALRRRPRPQGSHNLAQPLTSFIDRGPELAAIKSALLRSRLVTVLGPPGIGKSRLALEAGLSQVTDYRDGVWRIDIASSDDRHRLEQHLVERFADTTELKDLAWKQFLVLVDAAESNAEETAFFVLSVLGTCPAARVLTTSREVLQLSGEEVVQIGPLAAGDESASATVLVLDRARSAGVELSSEAALDIARRLDGIPLAIELVVSRLRHLDAQALRERLVDPLGLAVGTARNRSGRHESVRAAIESSVRGLEEAERILFESLTVFPASFHLDAAEQIVSGEGTAADDVVHGLTRLADISLVSIVRSPAGQLRYDFLGLIRRFAAEQLNADAEARLRTRFVEYHVHLARMLEPRLTSDAEDHASSWIDADVDNMRAALGWALEAEGTDDVLLLATVLAQVWAGSGRWSSGGHWLSRTIAGSGGPATTVLDTRLATLLQADGPDEMLARLAELAEDRGAHEAAAQLRAPTIDH